MRALYKSLLFLFIGTALTSCASTDSPVQKKADDKPNLFRAETPIADTLASRMHEFAQSLFKGVLDSVPGEYYYHTTNGKVDSLLKKEGEQLLTVASIAYSTPDAQNSYELKKGGCSYIVKDGVLTAEEKFPKYLKKYWKNGKLKKVLTGHLYKDNQDNIALDSGREEKYFKSGKIQRQEDWKDKKSVATKAWNENGVLIKEIDFPRSIKEYWDNGKTKAVSTGLLYINDQGIFRLDSGHAEFYFENGKIEELSDLKNKQVIGIKVWNEDGVLIKELDFPKYAKEYWNSGKLKGVMTGLLYRDNQGNTNLDSGHSESYFENGQVHQQNDWKNKQLFAQKEWNENGVLIKELDFPNYSKEYWNNGEKKVIATGKLYRNDKGIIKVDSGHGEVYFENGKMYQQNDWKDKQLVTLKEWNENGVLVAEIDFPKYIKEYWDNGKLKDILTGLLYRNNQGVYCVAAGHSEFYFENGKIKQQTEWNNKQAVTYKIWNENGVLIEELAFPHSLKKYWNNGKIKESTTGLLYRNDQGIVKVDSGHSEIYFENGKIKEQNDWRGKENIVHKQWNKSGVLITDLFFPEYEKNYSSNGTLVTELKGTLYYDNQKTIQVQDGFRKDYYNSKKLRAQKIYKEKRLVSKTEWHPNGNVSISAESPDRYWEFYDNGKIKAELIGTIAQENGDFKIKDGVYNKYTPNGEIMASTTYKDFQVISEKN